MEKTRKKIEAAQQRCRRRVSLGCRSPRVGVPGACLSAGHCPAPDCHRRLPTLQPSRRLPADRSRRDGDKLSHVQLAMPRYTRAGCCKVALPRSADGNTTHVCCRRTCRARGRVVGRAVLLVVAPRLVVVGACAEQLLAVIEAVAEKDSLAGREFSETSSVPPAAAPAGPDCACALGSHTVRLTPSSRPGWSSTSRRSTPSSSSDHGRGGSSSLPRRACPKPPRGL